MDGYEVCQRIKESPEGKLLPVVMVTALGQIADRVRGLEVGADDFIVKPIERVELVARVRSLLRVKQLYDRLDDAQRTIFALARAVEAKDSSTEAHTERVGINARRLGAAVGLPEDTLDDLLWGGVIHDIGKIGVPDAILLKPGPLTPEEFEVMKRHVFTGEEIARPLRSAHDLLPIIRHHHERIDGSGYPDGLRADKIPLTARIVAICDAFDAIISDRPYRKGLAYGDALRTLTAGAGTQWDAELVRVFQTLVSNPLPEPETATR
jgi:putative two-component system response regulator